MNRRQVLLGGVAGGLTLSTGCASLWSGNTSQENKPQLEVFVTNEKEEAITVTISALRGSTELFSHTYTLDSGFGDESESFVGTPTEVRVAIQNGRNVTRKYSIPSRCESPEVNVWIEPETVSVNNGCTSS